MGIASRTETHRTQLMTMWVTRQDQEFVFGNDNQIADIELVATTCELVGEPGNGGGGAATDTWRNTINTLAVNDVGVQSLVNGNYRDNRMLQRPYLNHGQVNVFIQGMTQGHQFRRDDDQQDNRLTLLVPTDLGLAMNRVVDSPTVPFLLERVEMQQRLRVHIDFTGNGPTPARHARFVQDWADSPPETAAEFRRYPDGRVRYFNGGGTVETDEGIAQSAVECQVPSNLILMCKLVFKVTPRSIL